LAEFVDLNAAHFVGLIVDWKELNHLNIDECYRFQIKDGWAC
jgi:hypothetical protein